VTRTIACAGRDGVVRRVDVGVVEGGGCDGGDVFCVVVMEARVDGVVS
jgi:hypothetical protein